MKPAPFDYVAPGSLEEVLATLATYGYDAKLLAGGQSLIPMMNFRLAQPSVLVDLNEVTELNWVRRRNGGVSLGAMVRQRQLERDPVVAEVAPLVHDTMPYVAHPQIRNRGTLGGSLAHADPAAELPVVMVALEAQLRLRRAQGERWVAAEAFFEGLFTTVLAPDEMVVEVVVPVLPPRTGYGFLEVARRHGDFAQAGVTAVLTLDENDVCRKARIVYLNLGEVPMIARKAADLLVGEKVTDSLIAEVADVGAREEIEPTGDIHATADYKRHLAGVLTRRVLKLALAKATSSQ
ncbi:MAG: xanthine dehydrogenase family protein subunit M [Chloroflexi bacterium]|nr:MAG: xanthine dehydrogenase family protein subunit M [Chloroflexota bacterium]